MYGKEAREILQKYNAYPSEERNKLSIDELKNLQKLLEGQKDLAEKEAEKVYLETEIWDDSKIRPYQEALDQVLKVLKYKEKLYRRTFANSFFGPIPK